MRKIIALVCAAVSCVLPACSCAEPAAVPALGEADRLYKEGRQLMQKGDYKNANERFSRAQRLLDEAAVKGKDAGVTAAAEPGKDAVLQADSWYNQAVMALRAKELKKAQSCLERAVELNPRDKDAYYNLGIIYERYLQDRNEALKCYLKYLLLEQDEAKALVVKGWVAALRKGDVHD